MKKHIPAALGLALTLGLAGCGGNGDQQNQQAAEPAGEPLATVNGYTITQEQFQFHLERRTQGQPQLAGPEDREALLEELVDLTLLAREAEQQGLLQDPTVAGRIANLRSAVLAQAMVEQLEQQEISDEELRAEYERRFADDVQMEYQARHILVEDEATARELIAQLQDDGDFAALAEEHSQDPGSAPRGGDLGWFQAGEMVGPFAEAVEQLEPGELTEEPVQSQFGWHVIQLEDTREAEPPAFEDVAPALRQMMVQDRIEEQLEELRAEAQVDIQRQP